MKYVFFGTPEFAKIILQGLIDAGMPPVAVVCNPDKPVGRKKIITPPLTKVVALQNNIPVFQPSKKSDLLEITSTLAKKADFAVVAAYAKIIPQEIIDKFKMGIIGVHPSLLPEFRGPSPIQFAILSGKDKTGTTLFQISKGVDDGPILAQETILIRDITYGELLQKLAHLSLDLLAETLPKFSKGEVGATPQNDSDASLTNFFEANDGLIIESDLRKALQGDVDKALEIWRKVRALNPEPGVYAIIDGKRIKLLKAHLAEDKLVLDIIQKEGRKPEVPTEI